jgi:hypothetical protein
MEPTNCQPASRTVLADRRHGFSGTPMIKSLERNNRSHMTDGLQSALTQQNFAVVIRFVLSSPGSG